MKKIGFVILTWNSIKYIDRCIESILNSDTFDSAISIFDNGSTDGTKEYLEKINNEKIVCNFSDVNLGTTKSRNIALKALEKCDFICVLDSDTEIIDYSGMKSMMDYLDAHPEVGIIGPKLKNKEGVLQFSARNIPTVKEKLYKVLPIKKCKKIASELEHVDYSKGDVIKVGYLMSACLLMTYSNFEKIGYFDEKIFYAPEDVDYCAKAWVKNLSVCYFQNCTVLHYWQRLSRKKVFSKHNFEHIKGLIYFWRKYRKSNLTGLINNEN